MRLTGTPGSVNVEQLRAHYRSVAAADDRYDHAITAADDPQSRWIGEAVLHNVEGVRRAALWWMALGTVR
jgi:hypothetical protein